MAELEKRRFTAVRWIAPLALAGTIGLGACGNGSDSDESVRTISPAAAAAGSDVHLANLAADLEAASPASAAGSDVHLANMASDPALRVRVVGAPTYRSVVSAEAAERDAHLEGNASTYGDDPAEADDPSNDEYVPGSRHMPVR